MGAEFNARIHTRIRNSAVFFKQMKGNYKMKIKPLIYLNLFFAGSFLMSISTPLQAEPTYQIMADAIFQVIEADRAVYADLVVNRLAIEEEVIEASENYHEDSALPLPAQMLRASAERVRDNKSGLSYSLISPWPINNQNKTKTDTDIKGMDFILKNPDKNYYAEESIKGVSYFTALYADNAVSDACVGCHNKHRDSPKKDFKINDVMGAVKIRIQMMDK